MVSTMCRSLVLPLFLQAVVLFTGCGTPKPASVASQAAASQRRGLPNQAQVDRFRSAASAVFQAHGFVETPIVVVGADSNIWLVTARTRSPGELTMATVKMAPEGQVTVDLAAYQRIGTDWALLGRLFRGPTDQEAIAMKTEIQERLERRAALAPQANRAGPAQVRSIQQDSLKVAVRTVLLAHGFSRPVFVDGNAATITGYGNPKPVYLNEKGLIAWADRSGPNAPGGSTLALVKTTPDGEVRVELVPWTDFQPPFGSGFPRHELLDEADEIEKQIQEKLGQ